MSLADVTRRSVDGRLRLAFTAGAIRTQMQSRERSAALQVQRLLELDPHRPRLATAILLNATAGLFAGDALRVELDVCSGAAAAVGTPAATRVFAMPQGSAATKVLIRVAGGGYLEYLPEPLVLCRDSALASDTRADLAAGACAAIGETIAFGRVAHGERFAHRLFDQRVALQLGGEPFLVERLQVSRDQDADLSLQFGGRPVYGALVLVVPVALTGTLLSGAREELGRCRKVWGGASQLHGSRGVAVRVLGDSASSVQALLRRIVMHFRDLCLPVGGPA